MVLSCLRREREVTRLLAHQLPTAVLMLPQLQLGGITTVWKFRLWKGITAEERKSRAAPALHSSGSLAA